MGKTVIKLENLSKAYQLGQFGTGTISRDFHRWWQTKVRGKEHPFSIIGEENDRSKKGDSDIVWSLRDINFQVEQGEAIGIIGKNGAGKSTLLKLLSRVTAPTSGKIKIKGRIASLLEVGTGFHPELTGRENIFLNGAILGMRKKEIASKLEEIIDFSGVERYVDTPVKRYSSGMYVRLAFSVAAHLESEILIVDEVLAVGDAEFQKKCLGKMGDINHSDGRTVLFVSHNMDSIAKLCKSSILLKNGRFIKKDISLDVISDYLELSSALAPQKKYNSSSWKKLVYDNFTQKLEINSIENTSDSYVLNDTNILTFSIKLKNVFSDPVSNLYIGIHLMNAQNKKMVISDFAILDPQKKVMPQNDLMIDGKLSVCNIQSGNYYLDIWVGEYISGKALDACMVSEVLHFTKIDNIDKLWNPHWGNAKLNALTVQ